MDASGVEEDTARAERIDALAALSDVGVDLIELSGGTYEHEPALGRPPRATRPARPAFEAYFAPFAEYARARVNVPIAVTGGFRSSEAMEDAIRGGVADVIGLARPLIADPDLPHELLKGERVRAPSPSARVGVAFLDAAAELFVQQEAMSALAHNRTAVPVGSRARVVLALARRLGG
jgi:2,4-dienoyl-CoA reductase-like NADH-dependent reductase (Old Yellow Enzyme family)